MVIMIRAELATGFVVGFLAEKLSELASLTRCYLCPP